ncbi:Flp family type IVb pilin [Thioalkalivibrio sp. ALE28]|uniref:Flp family type IVb pilin n=1 Tax=Thioalkalivibrio sp. ALE28 TaxID=1158179 RepID=UPI0003677929|nr:Flp family type IVb pilin [Thioalkalivibrio sp. ALE28]
MITMLKRLAADEEGASAIEYALIAALIAVAIIAGATALGEDLGAIFSHISGVLGSEVPD